MAKVTIIGATGNVGTFAAHTIAEIPYVSEILLVGRNGRENLLCGIAQDMKDAFAACGNYTELNWTTDISDTAGSDIVICAAGAARQAGQDRLDLALGNARIVASTSRLISEHAPETTLLMVTNPVDVMTSVALRYSGLEPSRVFGLGTHLDSMRLKSLIASFFKVHVSEVHTRIIGEHGESMVPLWSATTIGGIQISNLPAFSGLPVAEMVATVKTSGEAIIRNKGSTVFGPGEAIATLVQTVLGNENRILTVSAYVKSEVHDIGDVCIGVPARINREGVFPITIKIDQNEIVQFQNSVEKIRGITSELMRLLEKEEL
ncbi:MAG TPA: malate dehydrogenase [Methanoregulaceae archaeon]|jgi:malate dehydrogenase|nr:malate dehydrogenase [Methanomicrobiales archaeon]HNJ80202.1 malate dehydrogenase [Methanoregulaceae archaeon]HNL87046.1 malate dehydrogenase [Methanoregulaceae archaeon]HNO07616.1 malate dehydrogenase [Methanoregulaceae archaeon]HNW80012.1 malate dehydrogenase [Methanoregulaceae archaeon]